VHVLRQVLDLPKLARARGLHPPEQKQNTRTKEQNLNKKKKQKPEQKREMRKDVKGEFHDQADAEWMVIRGPLRGHNDTPCGRPAPDRPIGRAGVGRPLGEYGVFVNIN
jgi:hypothetical protein